MRTHLAVLALGASILLCAPRGFAADAPRVAFTPPEWDFGMILQGDTVQETVMVSNGEPADLQVTFVPTCTCLTVSPSTMRIPPGGKGAFLLRYDSVDDTGITKRGFIVRTDIPGAAPLYYLLRGVVRADNTRKAGQGSGSWAAPPAGTEAGAAPLRWTAPAGSPVVTLDYYYTPGCRTCEEFLSTTLPRLASERGIRLEVRRADLLVPAAYEELAGLAASRGEPLRAVPALRIGDVLLQGDAEIRSALPGLLDAAKTIASRGETARPAPAAPARAVPGVAPVVPGAGPAIAPVTAARLAVLSVAAAGLLDGINPCAFTTLIFLLASLALAGRGKAEVLLIGSVFSVSVFLSYFLIGLGFFAALRAAGAVSVLSLALRWVLVAVLTVFAGLSVYDYTLIRRGRATEMVLQLPTALKKRIHASIRTRVRAAALAGSSLVLGFLVSIFEFACTGQVYLPTLAYLARTGDRAQAFGLLVLYNLAFILPLLAVFGASYAGVSSARITAAFQSHMGKVKIGLALVFAALAVVTLVG